MAVSLGTANGGGVVLGMTGGERGEAGWEGSRRGDVVGWEGFKGAIGVVTGREEGERELVEVGYAVSHSHY